MLREHGTQRPSVFELLIQVHRMRGTKSRFTYHIAPPQPLSPRVPHSQSATQLDGLVSYRPTPSSTPQRPSPTKNTGIQARDKVLEAIAPMRRGRPSSSQPIVSDVSKPPSPVKALPETKKPKVDLLDDRFGMEEDNAWKAMKGSVSNDQGAKAPGSTSAMSAWKPKSGAQVEVDATRSVESKVTKDTRSPNSTFGDSFAESLWNAYDSNRAGSAATPISADKVTPSKIIPLEGSRTTKLVITKGKDAFEGLGLTASAPTPPTLGEARKLRTGLASVNAYSRSSGPYSPSVPATKPKTTASAKHTPSPRPSLQHMNSSWRVNPAVQTMASSVSSTAPAFPQIGDFSIETRFPSLEELDATLAYPQPTRYTTQPGTNPGNQNIIDLSVPSTSSIPLRPQPRRSVAPSTVVEGGLRSGQVTGNPVRETGETSRLPAALGPVEGISSAKRPSGRPPSRSSLPAKQVANISSKSSETQDLVDLTNNSSTTFPAPQKTREYKDLLTGDMDTFVSPTRERGVSDANLPETPVLREFTHKRSSFVEENNVHIQSPQEAVTGQQSPDCVVRASPSPTGRNSRSSRSVERKRRTSLSNKNSVISGRAPHPPSRRSLNVNRDSPTGSVARRPRRPSVERSSSSENWKGQSMMDFPREGIMSSSDEESPEDAVAFVASKAVEKSSGPRRKGRQSSVHDLVDLWGGGVVQTRERKKDGVPNPSTEPPPDSVTKPHKSRSIAISTAAKLNTSSPQYLQATNSGAIEVPRSPTKSPNRRSPNSHAKQMSAVSSTSSTPIAASRVRPQSLLAFPMSKSTSEGKSDIPVAPSSLSVPQDGSRVGGARRPSITDMVQRYEAIGKVVPKSPVAPGVSTTGRALQQSLHSPISSKFSPSRVAVALDDHPSIADTDKRQLPINSRHDYTGPTDKWVDASRVQSSVSGLPTSSSSKLLSHGSSQGGGIDGLPSTMTPTVNGASPPEEDSRSSSPEKPYQGVGKLIDQWQRKSEEASRSPALKRGYTTKRAGLVGGSVSRDN